jgi:peptidoglycan/LPS O-acetylase OafA/YrhL
MVLPSVISFCGLICWFDETHDFVHDLCYDLYWFFFLLAGFLAMLQPRILDSLQRNRRYSLTAGFLLMGLLIYMRLEHLQFSTWFNHPLQNPFFFASLSAYPLVAWTWVFAAIGYGKQYLDKISRVLHYINQAVYPFYILHQTVIVALAYFVVRWSDGIGMKYSFLVATTFFITIGIYHLFICRIPVLRFLFGMKPAKDAKPATRMPAPHAEAPSDGAKPARQTTPERNAIPAPALGPKIAQPLLQGTL